MARDFVNARRSGDSLVVTLTRTILGDTDISEGHQLLIETDGRTRIIITQEAALSQVTTKRVELEIEALEARKNAAQAESREWAARWNGGYAPPDFDDYLMKWKMAELQKTEYELAAQIAEKKLALLELTGRAMDTSQTWPQSDRQAE